ncbi:glycosyltransferase family 61 protein [Novosphingobium sp. BL-8A]
MSLRPGRLLFDRLLGTTRPDIAKASFERWQVAPRSCTEVLPAKALPGQIERISGTRSGTVKEVARYLKGGFDVIEAATMGYCIRDVLLHDGMLHARGGLRRLRPGSRFTPLTLAPRETGRIALYESWLGNRCFAGWLGGDCLTYRLAEEAGAPFTTGQSGPHVAEYESALRITPASAAAIHCDELVLFDDAPHNEHKRARADDMRRRLVRRPVERHRGVFLLSYGAAENWVGSSAERSAELANELAVAEYLAARHGFRVLAPSRAGIAEIARACGGAEIVAGVDGNHLVHGLVMMPPDARALVIQPQTRAGSALKRLTDRQGQNYALVVARGTNDGFAADIDEIARTLDLV